jgi:hypothetical protein
MGRTKCPEKCLKPHAPEAQQWLELKDPHKYENITRLVCAESLSEKKLC